MHEQEGRVTRESGQRSHDCYRPSHAHEAEVFLPYDAVVERRASGLALRWSSG
jgi:hypothetical protein